MYNVNLEIFQGPLDLLLHLIEKMELDIYNIPIAKLTESYLEYINTSEEFSLEIAEEYIVMAATLLHIKSKSLLPKFEEDVAEEEEDLVQQLLDYKNYKELSTKLEILQKMYKEWPFFRSTISNVDMVLSKTDLSIFAEYVKLASNQETAQKIFKEIEKEWVLTIDILKKITGNNVLLADNPELVSSLRNRLPYFDSMNYLQIELIKRSRAGDDSEELRKAIHISINGLATGLRNSG